MTTTKHKPDCKRVFKRYDLTCPRCHELAEGFAPRAGWTRPRPTTTSYAKHDCKASGCLPICTWGDW